ncbi:MAG: hypothetical protein IIB40_02275 [Candidatus Marinimicrobia bacterium]|nr:hypothetical protein [Candidatus Neomarinimicrobiota bacterium]
MTWQSHAEESNLRLLLPINRDRKDDILPSFARRGSLEEASGGGWLVCACESGFILTANYRIYDAINSPLSRRELFRLFF